tara:strand:- start:255 stop:1136 length:882 start_codon:yes stop_codon:yes gene_type:complete
MNAYIFPGQGAQYPEMGLELYNNSDLAKDLFEKANVLLEFNITEIMFGGSVEDLKQTKVTQPAIFLHSVILSKTLGDNFNPDMVAGHSLGEFSALVANNTLSFEDGLRLVSARAKAMQKACDNNPGTMAAVLGLENNIVEEVCKGIDGIVVAANYNCPGQLVISGEIQGINLACEKLKESGARRALVLPVGGAFHSPLMEDAKQELEDAIKNTVFNKPICPVYQNVSAEAVSDETKIKENLISQLTSPVKWTQSIEKMIQDGGNNFIEIGPGKVLQGLVRKINSNVEASSISN